MHEGDAFGKLGRLRSRGRRKNVEKRRGGDAGVLLTLPGGNAALAALGLRCDLGSARAVAHGAVAAVPSLVAGALAAGRAIGPAREGEARPCGQKEGEGRRGDTHDHRLRNTPRHPERKGHTGVVGARPTRNTARAIAASTRKTGGFLPFRLPGVTAQKGGTGSRGTVPTEPVDVLGWTSGSHPHGLGYCRDGPHHPRALYSRLGPFRAAGYPLRARAPQTGEDPFPMATAAASFPTTSTPGERTWTSSACFISIAHKRPTAWAGSGQRFGERAAAESSSFCRAGVRVPRTDGQGELLPGGARFLGVRSASVQPFRCFPLQSLL